MNLNEAGEALKALGLGAVRLRYAPADTLVPRDRFTVWLDANASEPDEIGCGGTPEEALADALAKREARNGAA